jgi:hypothetical protein
MEWQFQTQIKKSSMIT